MSDQWLSLFEEKVNDLKQQNEEQISIPVSQFLQGEYLPDSRIFVRTTDIRIEDLVQNKNDYQLAISLRKYARIFLNKTLNPEKILFIDTETTGLSRSQGTYVFMLGIGQIKGDLFQIRQYFVEEMNQEITLYQHLMDTFRETELFVSYNGKSFDVPLLQSRLILLRQDINLRLIPHLDLLPVTRRLWKNKVDSFSLSRMEYHLFEKMRDAEFDVPGFMIPALYAEYQQSGNPEKLISVFYHNEDDIASLLAIYGIVTQVFNDECYVFASETFNLLEIGRLYEQINEPEKALLYFNKALEKNEDKAEIYLARLYKKLKSHESAEKLWLNIQNEESSLELSKYYEKQKNYALALDYAKKAIAFSCDTDTFTLKKQTEYQKRTDRLLNKIRSSA